MRPKEAMSTGVGSEPCKSCVKEVPGFRASPQLLCGNGGQVLPDFEFFFKKEDPNLDFPVSLFNFRSQ